MYALLNAVLQKSLQLGIGQSEFASHLLARTVDEVYFFNTRAVALCAGLPKWPQLGHQHQGIGGGGLSTL